jgi:hypothetical protein
VNSHTNKLFRKRKWASYFVTVGVIVRRGDVHRTTVEGNDDSRWNSDGVVLLLGRRENGEAVEWWGEWPRLI